MKKYILLTAFLVVLPGCGRMQPAAGYAVLLSPTPAAAPAKTPVPGVFDPKSGSYKPDAGFVPDEETAIAIAVAVWNPIYGKKHIDGEKPFHATLKNGVWSVSGSLPDGWVGGVAEAEISKEDGRILKIIHGK